MIDFINGGGVTTPLGFTAAAANADIKGKGKDRNDLAILVSDEPCVAAALFTKNLVQAAPVIYSKDVLKDTLNKISAIIANSGNANACTGVHGLSACDKTASSLADELGIDKKSVLVASTGVIGVQLPYEKLLDKIPSMVEDLNDDGGADFAKAIMTTDTFAKETAVFVETSKGSITIGGTCKGAGMIAPSVATMLTFITTDADIDQMSLYNALKSAADGSFNSVTVDGDTSTNDSVFLLANGMSGVKIDDEDYKLFAEALEQVCLTLAKMMAKDGEGAKKLVTVNVKNARSVEEAKLCASKIANSPLVKTMFAGCDPNWGRLLASAGASGAIFDPNKVDIYFEDLFYVSNGMIIDYALEEKAFKIMKRDEYEITIDLKAGKSAAHFYTCDFTADYVRINADYRS